MKRNITIDILKGFAIIAVVLYHLGISQYGYLGVDVFFVISGYLVAIGMSKNFDQNTFSYWQYLNKRLARLWPGVVLISTVAFVLGWFFMMPQHFKLNCESIVGSLTYTNNFVQYITGGDYWTTANEFKPLMHTWYIGILMQYYLIFPLIFIIAKKFSRNRNRWTIYILCMLSLLSALLYVSPLLSPAQNFYLLPSRFFELGTGSLLAIITLESDESRKKVRPFYFTALFVFAVALIFGPDAEMGKLRLVSIVALSIGMVWCSNYFSVNAIWRKFLSPIIFLGTASYSIYLSHQLFFAFYRYIVNSVFTLSTYLWVLAVTILIGVILYFVFEKQLSEILSKCRRAAILTNGICLMVTISLSAVCIYYYKQKGLVRDIPELDLYVGQNGRTPEEYNSEPFKLDKDFKNNGKRNILVIGDSFGRDWINILRESGVDSVMNISYTMYADDETRVRIEKADIIFVATIHPFFSSYNYDKIYPELFNKKFWRVGIKSFGENFIGNIYNKRGTAEYFHITVKEAGYSKESNAYEKRMFNEHFIDMISPIIDDNGEISMLTKDNKLITEDGIHLTEAGAKLYADRINVWEYLK